MLNLRSIAFRSSRYAHPVTFVLGMLFALVLAGLHGSLKQSLPAIQPIDQVRVVHEPCTSNSQRWVLDMRPGTSGGVSSFTPEAVNRAMADPLSHGMWEDLLAFTGLNASELIVRLTRQGRHHFAVEHRYHEPRSKRELAMYYRSSLGYLWGNSMHPSVNHSELDLTAADGPILDYSGGVGNVVLGLAKKGIQAVYFGIGQAECEFAQFRVRRHGLSHLVNFVKPYAEKKEGGLRFDPVQSLKLGTTIPRKLGGIFAIDVFEHIPNYQLTARHLVSLLRKGGKLWENSEFNQGSSEVDIHLRAAVPLETALLGMHKVRSVWRKKTKTGYVPIIHEWVKDTE